MIDLSRDGFTHEQIKRALHSSNRQERFRYELLDKNNRKIRDMTNVMSGEVSQSMLGQIKRLGRFSLIEDGQPIDYLNNRIKPYMRIKVNTSWVDFPLGVFLMSTPTRNDEVGTVRRDIAAYDLTLILLDDKFLDRYTIVEGTPYYEALIGILSSAGINQYNIEHTEKSLPRTIEFEPGISKLEAINELLNQLNYTPIHVDENGYFVSRLYVSPAERSADYDYIDNEQSVTLLGAEEELDTFNVPNVFNVVRTNEEQMPLRSTFINNNPDSPLSTVNRGRNIVDHREIDNIADQESLDAYVERIAFEASQVYGRIKFETALMPFHGYANVLNFRYQPLGINNKYLELNWKMPLVAGGQMEHELRQVVTF